MKPAPTKFLRSFLVALGVIVAVVGIVQFLRVQVSYRATASVQVLPGIEAGMTVGTEVESVLQTEADTILSELILKAVVEKLDLNTAWGKRYNDGQKFKTTESCAILKACLKTATIPGSALIQIDVTRDDADETVKIANTIAEAYCDYRVDRRRRIAENTVKSITEPFKNAEEKLNTARTKLETARNALASDMRSNPPEFSAGENPALRAIQVRHNKAMIQFLSCSNQLASATNSISPDTNRIARATAEFVRAQDELVAAEKNANMESQRWAALREYWSARENFEGAEKFFAPFKKVAEEAEAANAPSNKPPAVIEVRAERAATIETHDVSRGAVMFGIAGVLILAGFGVPASDRSHGRVENQKGA